MKTSPVRTPLSRVARHGALLGITALAPFVHTLPASAATVEGDAGANSLIGTPHHDTIRGFGGADIIEGRAGTDVLYGHGGADRIEGGAGYDGLLGGAGPDRLLGGPDGDVFRPRAGTDLVKAGSGWDEVFLFDDGEVDLIFCGNGEDGVAYKHGDVDKHDVLHGCEHLGKF